MEQKRAKYTVAQVANYILRYYHNNNMRITPFRLQFLVYQAYGWYLAITGERLFDEPIEAWGCGWHYHNNYIKNDI